MNTARIIVAARTALHTIGCAPCRRWRSATRIACLLMFVACASVAAAEDLSFSGKVVRVIDGDTIDVLRIADGTKKPERIRLSAIDAPESGQAYGTRAKQQLLALVGGRDAQVLAMKRDRYGRIVGKVIVGDQDANLAMIRAGAAWWYEKYRDEQSQVDQALYGEAEKRARSERIGLWADPHAMAPWEWRHRPQPPEGYAAACPCGSGRVCTGQRGGQFCVRDSGTKKYFPRE